MFKIDVDSFKRQLGDALTNAAEKIESSVKQMTNPQLSEPEIVSIEWLYNNKDQWKGDNAPAKAYNAIGKTPDGQILGITLNPDTSSPHKYHVHVSHARTIYYQPEANALLFRKLNTSG